MPVYEQINYGRKLAICNNKRWACYESSLTGWFEISRSGGNWPYIVSWKPNVEVKCLYGEYAH